jgi:hypothetical protein
MIAKTPAGHRIEWPTVAVLGLVLAALVVVWVTGPEHRGDILAALGTVGALLLAVMRPMLVPPSVFLLVFLGASGCGASALRQHATIASVSSAALAAAAPMVPAACDAALTACHGSEGCVMPTAERCRIAAASVEVAVASVRGYADAIEVASMADEGEVMPALLSALGGVTRLWAALVAALLSLGVELPALPALAATLLGGAS